MRRLTQYIVWAAYLLLHKSLKQNPVIQRRLEFLKAVRFGRYVLNDLVWWVSCEGPNSLGRIFFKRILGTNPVIQHRLDFLKAVRFGSYTLKTNLLGGLHGRAYIVWAAYSFLDKSLKTTPVIQRRLECLKAVNFWRYVLKELVWWVSCEGLHSLGRIFILG